MHQLAPTPSPPGTCLQLFLAVELMHTGRPNPCSHTGMYSWSLQPHMCKLQAPVSTTVCPCPLLLKPEALLRTLTAFLLTVDPLQFLSIRVLLLLMSWTTAFWADKTLHHPHTRPKATLCSHIWYLVTQYAPGPPHPTDKHLFLPQPVN